MHVLSVWLTRKSRTDRVVSLESHISDIYSILEYEHRCQRQSLCCCSGRTDDLDLFQGRGLHRL